MAGVELTDDPGVHVRAILRTAAAVCRACGLEGQARALERAKVDPRARYQCAVRTVLAVDMATKAAWGAKALANPGSPLARAVQATSIACCAVTCAQAGGRDASTLLRQLWERERELLARVSSRA